MAARQNTPVTPLGMITVNVPSWKRALEGYYEKPMTPIQGGFQMRVLGKGDRRLTISLYTRRGVCMVQGHAETIDDWVVECAASIAYVSGHLEAFGL
jgi:hypothetical protein